MQGLAVISKCGNYGEYCRPGFRRPKHWQHMVHKCSMLIIKKRSRIPRMNLENFDQLTSADNRSRKSIFDSHWRVTWWTLMIFLPNFKPGWRACGYVFKSYMTCNDTRKWIEFFRIPFQDLAYRVMGRRGESVGKGGERKKNKRRKEKKISLPNISKMF